MDYAYALASADTGVDVTEGRSRPIVEIFEWGSVVAECQKQMGKDMKKGLRKWAYFHEKKILEFRKGKR